MSLKKAAIAAACKLLEKALYFSDPAIFPATPLCP
jgi:hypothetical protein